MHDAMSERIDFTAHGEAASADAHAYKRLLRVLSAYDQATADLVAAPRDWSGIGSAALNDVLREYRSPVCLAGLAIASPPVMRAWQMVAPERADVRPNWVQCRDFALALAQSPPLPSVLQRAIEYGVSQWEPVRTRIGRALGFDV